MPNDRTIALTRKGWKAAAWLRLSAWARRERRP